MTWTKTFIGVLAFFSLHQAETPLDTKHHVVFGSVVDKVSGEPLSSVYIYAVRGEEEASTDAKGEFRFKSWQSLPIILHVQMEGKEVNFTIKNPVEKIVIRI